MPSPPHQPVICRHLIGGRWSDEGETRLRANPSDTNDIAATWQAGTRATMQAAVAAAQAALPVWSQTTPQTRFDVLDAAGTELLARKAELGDLLAREEGKTLAEAIGEVARAGQIFKFFAGEALRLGGELLPSVRPGIKVEITREPVGVVGLITPWNFPIAIPAWKTAPALAFGNTVILKPAEMTPGCARALADILMRAGLPAGAFNVVFGDGAVLGPALIDGVDAVSFTGSVATGGKIALAAAARGIRAQLEMGGKNPLVVLDDADLDVAVACALNGAFFSTGQRCTASSRLIVTEGIADRFAAALATATAALRVGNARAPTTQIGPLASERQCDTVTRYIETGKAEGGQVITGGEPVTADTPGWYLAPTLFDVTTRAMTINREEVFGPVAAIIRVKDYEAALEEANATQFGLVGGICTTTLRYAEDFKRRIQTGMAMVNLPTAGVDYHVPFGGRKASSLGPREQGSHAREFYTTVKTAYQAS
jgi:aldehyde dehydrogenase (NAD+)